MDIEKLLEKIPTTMQKTFAEKICDCGKTKTETLFYQLVIEGDYCSPLNKNRSENEGNRYSAFYFSKFTGKKLYYDISCKTLKETLEKLYIQLKKDHLIK